ncbi:MAG: hypothetical protein KAR30_04800, partial [Gammaproteobacteria bacterium]|nr:hypothetical protein [Gammaproteobacteria bacterium]
LLRCSNYGHPALIHYSNLRPSIRYSRLLVPDAVYRFLTWNRTFPYPCAYRYRHPASREIPHIPVHKKTASLM